MITKITEMATESMTCEFKDLFRHNHRFEYAKCINSFMNTKGGSLWFGVSGGGTATGFYMTPAIEHEIRRLFDNIEIRIFPKFQGRVEIFTQTVNARRVVKTLEVRVTRNDGDHPTYYTYYGGAAFRRMNAGVAHFDTTEFVKSSELLHLQTRCAELEDEPVDPIEKHLWDSLNIKSAKRFADRGALYKSLDLKTFEEFKKRDNYIAELKAEILQGAAELAERDKKHDAELAEMRRQLQEEKSRGARLWRELKKYQ